MLGERVRGRDEHHVRQVIVQVEVVIVERAVLLRVEHLEQRRRRISAEIRRHLVDLVEQDHGVVRPGFLQAPGSTCPASRRCTSGDGRGSRLRHGRPPSDNRTNLRPVARAMLRHKLVLPTPGGPTKQRTGPFNLLGQRLHRQVLEDALLDPTEAVVVLVEDRLGRVRDRACLRTCRTRGASRSSRCSCARRRLGARRVHHLQLLQLLLDLLVSFFAHLLGLELLFDLLDLVLELVRSPPPSSFWMACICSFK